MPRTSTGFRRDSSSSHTTHQGDLDRLEVPEFSPLTQQLDQIPSNSQDTSVLSSRSRNSEHETNELSIQSAPPIDNEHSETTIRSPEEQIHVFDNDEGVYSEHDADQYAGHDTSTLPMSENNDPSAINMEFETCVQIIRHCLPSFTGIFDIIARLSPADIALIGISDHNVHLETLSPILIYALTAIIIEADRRDLSNELPAAQELVIDSLRTKAIRMIPTLTWSSRDFNVDQVLALNSSSQFWCMQKSLVMVAARWNVLSQLIWDEVQVDLIPSRNPASRSKFL